MSEAGAPPTSVTGEENRDSERHEDHRVFRVTEENNILTLFF